MPATVQPAPKMVTDRMRASNCKIMLVDDDADVRAVTLAGLSEAGFEVLDFDSGLAALAAFDEHRDVELLVTDYAMPAMNGIELIERLREHVPQLPVIVITGYANPVASLAVPEDLTVLHKPFRIAELVDCILTTFTRRARASNVVPLAKPLSP